METNDVLWDEVPKSNTMEGSPLGVLKCPTIGVDVGSKVFTPRYPCFTPQGLGGKNVGYGL